MNECEKYRKNIEGILKRSDLSTVTTKRVRHALESETGASFNLIKKQINVFIEDIFLSFQEQEEERKKFIAEPTKSVKKTERRIANQPAKIAKKAAKKKKEPKERKPVDWPLLKVAPPLSDIIQTKLCSRPQTVKKLWEYIKAHQLQGSQDKRIIHCDEKFKELCDGAETITAFSMNKYIQKYFEKIPLDQQAKYKQYLKEQEERENGSSDGELSS